MRVAVITPYYKPRLDWLRQCHDSVLAQTHPCTHILVADGEPLPELDGWQIQHIRCNTNHGDYGDTPRGIGSMSAIGQGFDAITYLDADNWHTPDHIASLLALHRETRASVCIANRNLHRPDGSLFGPCPETDGEFFADTSSILLTRKAFMIAAIWAMMDPKLHAIDDRVIMWRIRDAKLKRAFNPVPTVCYRMTFPAPYLRAGETPPPEAKGSTKPMEEAYEHLIAKGGPDLRPKYWQEIKAARAKKKKERKEREAKQRAERQALLRKRKKLRGRKKRPAPKSPPE